MRQARVSTSDKFCQVSPETLPWCLHASIRQRYAAHSKELLMKVLVTCDYMRLVSNLHALWVGLGEPRMRRAISDRRSKAASRGFSLIELLIVVAIILIIAAIAIPNLLRARMAANESSAASSVRQISRAEMAYYAAYPDKGYADALINLSGPEVNCQPTVTSACLLDTSLSSGQKSGYNFLATGALPSGPMNTAFVVGAAPITYESSGSREFCSIADGVLRAQTGAAGDPPPSDVNICAAFPAAQ